MQSRASMTSMKSMIRFLSTFREWKKYHILLCLLNYLHYYWAASKPMLYYQKTPMTQVIDKCSLLGRILLPSQQYQDTLLTCGVVVEKYHPTWYLFNGHLQTFFLALGNRFPMVPYCRELLHLDDGGLVSLDWAVPPSQSDVQQQHDHPTILLLHGSCGGSWENYMRKAVDELMQNGWRVVVMNSRGCSKTPVLTPRLFNAADTGDIRQVVTYLRRKHVPKAPLLAVGFSLGANLLVKYLGEEGDKCQITAAVSVGNPFDGMEIFRHMHHSSYATQMVYYRAMTKKFLRLFFEESNAHEHFVNHPTVDLKAMKSCATMWDVDQIMACKVFGYRSVNEYYRDCSSTPYVLNVKIPLLCLSAKDDPVCVHTAVPIDDCLANENIILAMTHRGGHLGFFTGNNVFSYPETWSVQAVAQYCDVVTDLLLNRNQPEKTSKPTSKVEYKISTSNDEDQSFLKISPMPPGLGDQPVFLQAHQQQQGMHDDLVDELILCDGVPMHQVVRLGAAFVRACIVYSKVDHIVGRWWWCCTG
ncbi:hypothetical protein AeMF1_016734 [Aphanomyces euteiches]|nr:hypothetical protein AeMF1_016734 [Aphanomyces euteiches]